jgi:ABC-type lipoprotein export system ATPase subunit
LIRARDLVKVYKTPHGETVAVDGVSFDVAENEFVIVHGPPGCGKSTLLSITGALTKPTRGTLMLKGTDLYSMGNHALSRTRGREIGFVFQFAGLPTTLTVFENVVFPSFIAGNVVNVDKRVFELLDMVGLSGKADLYPSSLSVSDSIRTAIARALMNDPSVIIADEPTGDLNRHDEDSIMEIFQNIHRQGKTIVMGSEKDELRGYGGRTIELDQGRIRT